MSQICSISGCTCIVTQEGAKTCGLHEHYQIYADWRARFGRQAIHGIRCHLRAQRYPAEQEDAPSELDSRPELFQDNGSDFREHQFQARHVYCLEAIQWACGIPIAFGKCYGSESPSQVSARYVNVSDM